jgi:hypothetical protein
MSKIKCDDPDFVWAEQPLSRPRHWKKSDGLTPTPPKDWLIMLSLGSTPQGLDIGCWICALSEIQGQKHPADYPWQMHMIARKPKGDRVLLVHPMLQTLATDTVAWFNGAITNCNCGGSDCLAGEEQYKAVLVLARRAWGRLPIHERITRLQESGEEDVNVGMALAGPEILRQPLADDYGAGIGFLEEITGAR